MSVYKQIIAQFSLYDYLVKELHYEIAKLPLNVKCPLHKDNKPSLRLYNPKENQGYCFSCGKSYNAINIHRALSGTSLKDTITYLAQTYNLHYKTNNSTKAQDSTIVNHSKIAQLVIKDRVILRDNPHAIQKNFTILLKKINKYCNNI